MSTDEAHELEVTVEELQQRLEQGESLTLIDVREPRERRLVKIETDDEWIPVRRVPGSLDRIKTMDTPVVFYCHSGVRSLRMAHVAREKGLDDAYSLRGGIDEWARDIDPSLPRY